MKNKRIPVRTDKNETVIENFMRRLSATIRLVLLLSIAGCSKGYAPEPPDEVPIPAPTVTIAEFQRLYLDRAVVIREPVVLTGIVTTSDRAGNFYRTLCIEQNRAAIEIRTGTENSYTRYPVGCRVYLRAEGLCMERRHGVLQIGPPASSSAAEAVDYFQAQSLLDRYLIRGELEEPHLTGTLRTPDELNTSLCGTLILITGLRHEPTDEEEGCWEGYHRFVDNEGNVLRSYVSPYARFARQPIPAGEVVLRGILQEEEKKEAGFILKLRDETDCLD